MAKRSATRPKRKPVRRGGSRRPARQEEPDTPPDSTAPQPAATPEPTRPTAPPTIEDETAERPLPPLRIALVAGAGTTAAAVMAGGIFIGLGGRITAVVAGALGIVVGIYAGRLQRAWLMYIAIFAGLFITGMLMVLPDGFSHISNLTSDIREATGLRQLLRPPVDFLPGWKAILGWLMAAIGFGSVWAGLELRRPALALIVPLPIVAIAGISVPESSQLATGLVALGLFAVGLGVLSGLQLEGSDEQASLAYELRRAIRAVPLIGVVTLVLYLLAQTNFLFPDPLYDPAEEAQIPKAIPLDEVEDRVLFTVDSDVSGPWRTGVLDVYDGEFWRLPPFADAEFLDVPKSGIVDPDIDPSRRADIVVEGLTGAVLPGLPSLHAVTAAGPSLVYDERAQNIRLEQGQLSRGLEYALIFAGLPTVDGLRGVGADVPPEIQQYLEIPDMPVEVQALLSRAPGGPLWDRFDFVRTHILENVVAAGSGTPVAVTPERVGEILTVDPEATPFEIVATQALLARWAGVPSRIGYGFDGGDENAEGLLEVRPLHGSTWIEVYFQGFGWLPVIGKPREAKTTLSEDPQQATDLNPSQDVAVQVYLPTVLPTPSQFVQRARTIVAIVVPIIAVIALIYYLWPLIRKSILRSRRRTWALNQGPEARIAVAYAEWRDQATDFGFRHQTDTPLMFLTRVTPDEEHAELAWLVTRALWGDMRDGVTVDDAVAAEELSRSLRRRLSQTQSWAMRAVGALSRLSLRQPYAPELGAREEVARAA